ncbi:LysE family translocator [Arcicella rosea]|uniref:Threonine/homoserine/homoserine lactone efflux protein n=1 Tax=Arcicella rosea TaxID=502909 RepID=A0A841ERA8_9BACT|nr:LysE family transporter [Arcicella rosea]MBB6005476.1 threonine/homoserine/homoserine lactone efflux protein [Arcicella rosea]
MINAVVWGFLYGFLLCFTFGPAFFRLIQTSIDNGFKRGLLIAGGVTVADAILMFCAVFGTSFLPKFQYFNLGIALVGSSILFILGFNSLFKQQTQLVYPKSKFGSFLYYFTSGILLNLLNPSNYIAVFATSTYLSNVEGFSINETIVFFIASLFATMLAESLIAFYAQKMKSVLTAKILKRINQVAGIIFIISGMLILWKQFW